MEPQAIDIKVFQTILLTWFKEHGRWFPWRESGLSSYQLLIAEILLQRTKAATVDKIFTHFFNVYPNWKVIASAKLEEIENTLKPIGLHKQRAERLQKLAQKMNLNDSVLLSSRAELDAIPFIGQYIGNAVELLIQGKNKPLLDVNMARVLERYFGHRKLKDLRYDKYLQALAHDIVDHPDSISLNWAILDFAALVCQSRVPKCSTCVLQQTCTYYLTVVEIKNFRNE
ncbi:endonuclease III domain-containing protein [Mucilaginibacter galii]|nr:hypothetical protein [Mucilaginibacter galii]